jgi:signal transduction histidine kinase
MKGFAIPDRKLQGANLHMIRLAGNGPFGLQLPAPGFAYFVPMLFRALAFLLLVLAVPICGPAVPMQVPMRAYTANDGLGGATITSLIKDPRGFLWIGTPDELLVYDGRRFLPFRYPDAAKPGAMLPFRRAVMTQVDNDRLLIFHDGGIHEYSYSSGMLRIIPAPLPGVLVTSGATLNPDDNHPGWYRLTSGLVTASYNPATRQWTDARPLRNSYGIVLSVRGGRPALLNNDTSDGRKTLYAIDPATGRELRRWQAPFPLSAATWLANGTLLLQAAPEPAVWWMPDGGPMRRLATIRPFAFSTSVADAGAGIIYLAAGQTLLRFSPGSGEASELLDDAGRPLVRKGVITHLLLDGNSLWVGTNASGLLRVSLNGPRFRHLHSKTEDHNFTHAIFPQPAAGTVYAGTYYGKIVVYDTSGAVIGELPPPLPGPGRRAAYINAIEPLADGALFIVTGGNAYIYNPATKGSINLAAGIESELRAVGIDPANDIGRKGVSRIGPQDWWISIKDGLAHWHLEPATAGQPPRLRLKRIVPIAGTPEAITSYAGAWWCATSGKLYRIGAGQVSDSFDLPLAAFATSLQADGTGRLWIATERGIIVWQGGKTLRILTTECGLPNNHVYALLPDQHGWMWGSSNGGLFAVRSTDFGVRAFTGGDGLQGAEFNLGAAARDAQGRLYFGGMNGVNSFLPAEALREALPGPVTITRVAAPDTVYYSYPGPRLKQLQLSHDHANLQLNFAAARPVAGSPLQYEYRLSDADSAWIEAGLNGELQLRLAPGTYNIVIRQRGLPAGAAMLSVTVAPPFYRTLWFLLLSIAVGGAALAAIIIGAARSRYRRRVAGLETARRIQEEKERISRELHDELGARVALIAHNAAQLRDAASNDTAAAPLAGRIAETTADMLNALRETVWTLNQETVSVGSLWLRYVNFIAKLGATYGHIRFAVTEHGELPASPVHYSSALNLLRILQEATMNAVKHSGASEIRAAVLVSAQCLRFTVTDNGRGFDVTAAQRAGLGNGLYNMTHRSREAGLDLVIRSDEHGTIVEVVMQCG